MATGVVAFLDLLGFSYFCRTDQEAAGNLLLAYQLIVKQKWQDYINHPPQSYSMEALSNLALQHSMNSFNYFIPCSDSIFITSHDPNLFLEHASSFLMDCLFFSTAGFEQVKDYSAPYSKIFTHFNIYTSGGEAKATMARIKENMFPVLFRGGTVYGDYFPIDQSSVVGSSTRVITNLFGSGVVRAVHLEKCGAKGPRLLCDKSFIDLLNSEHRRYTLPVGHGDRRYTLPVGHGEIHEILWPTFYLVEHNNLPSLQQLLRFTSQMYRAIRDRDAQYHYEELIRLIIKSTKIWESICGTQNAEGEIESVLSSEGLDYEFWRDSTKLL